MDDDGRDKVAGVARAGSRASGFDPSRADISYFRCGHAKSGDNIISRGSGRIRCKYCRNEQRRSRPRYDAAYQIRRHEKKREQRAVAFLVATLESSGFEFDVARATRIRNGDLSVMIGAQVALNAIILALRRAGRNGIATPPPERSDHGK